MTAKRAPATGLRNSAGVRLNLIALAASTALIMPSQARGEFRDLANFAPGALWYAGLGVSGDGNYVVGEGIDGDGVGRGFFYDVRSGAGQDIGLFVAGQPTIATDVSNTGVVAGTGNIAFLTSRAVIWTRNSGFVDLGTLEGAAVGESFANAISDDGNRVVGGSTMQGGNPFSNGFLWIRGATGGVSGNGQMYHLQALPGGDGYSSGEDISGDGRYAAGTSATVGIGARRAVRWNLTNIFGTGTATVEDLGTLGGGFSDALAINTDGKVVVGWSTTGGEGVFHAFRWEEGGVFGVAGNPQMEDLGTLGGGFSKALAVSGDGAIVVGSSDDNANQSRAFRWTRETGMLSLSDWLAQNDIVVGDVALIEATSVSNNGDVIVGRMNDPDNADGDTPFIARTGARGSGLMNVSEYNSTLYDAGYVGWAGGDVFRVPLNGSHHRVLKDFSALPNGTCGWLNGDIARFDDGRETGVALAEVGVCGDLADDTLRVGLGGGLIESSQDMTSNGSAQHNGRYLVGELNWRPEAMPVILSVTGLYGASDVEIRRAYSNGAAMAYSDADTDLVSGTLRIRADWQDAFRFHSSSFSPYLSYAVSRTSIDDYTETGGSFPATFDKQVVGSGEVRLGLASRTELNSAVAVRNTLELVHGSGDAPHAKGQVVGLQSFSFGGGSYAETWLRVGADLDVKLADRALLSLSMHAATEGLDAQISGAARFQIVF
ncbi:MULTISPECIES: autotransporter domain-containing protein [unclassified Rhizobium]|uniref:autotransporter domain-containing protein n=1 Tax=unclassified Rhizobium TaxID=2613769 RepID=UPI0009E95DD9|nr:MULTISPECIES: autotransporter domain-containing protein [unclassified Rhizobium]